MIGKIKTVKGVDHYFLDGKEVSKAAFDKATDLPIVVRKKKTLKRGYPYESMAIVVHPDDRQAAMDMAQKMGVPTEYNHNGSAIIRDAAHRKALMKANGIHDRNSYNGY